MVAAGTLICISLMTNVVGRLFMCLFIRVLLWSRALFPDPFSWLYLFSPLNSHNEVQAKGLQQTRSVSEAGSGSLSPVCSLLGPAQPSCWGFYEVVSSCVKTSPAPKTPCCSGSMGKADPSLFQLNRHIKKIAVSALRWAWTLAKAILNSLLLWSHLGREE